MCSLSIEEARRTLPVVAWATRRSAGVNQRTAITIVADAAIRWQCRGAVQHYDGWRQAIADGTQLLADQRLKLASFIQRAFGVPAR
jgi:hypothetical protein